MTNSVAIVMGSKSDMALAEATKEVLDGYGIGSVIKVLSAHRTPEALKEFIENTIKDGGPLNGLDALFSTVQMPRGVPVATVAIGKAGAVNAGHLAAQMLGTGDEELAKKIADQREEQKRILLEDQ